MSEVKAKLYKTAQATISCALFREGDFVSVKFLFIGALDGIAWFEVSKDGKTSTVYPEFHLTRFCL